jgi:hypothetical protein
MPGNFIAYNEENGLFKIAYPNQWLSVPDMADSAAQLKDAADLLKSGKLLDKANIFLLSGLKTDTGYCPNVVVIVEPSPSDILTLEQAVQTEIDAVRDMDPKYQEVSRNKTTVSGQNAFVIEYKAHFAPDGPLMHDYFLVSLIDKNLWTVTCTSTDADYKTLSADFDNIIRSFQLTGLK